jgi:hypothetical protein
MFEYMAIHSRIVVTGPQRSGTTIAAKMIAHDTGHRYVDEAEFAVYDVEKWEAIAREEDRVVVQCPHMLKVIVDSLPPDIFVVLMRRNLEDIHNSQRRIDWECRFKGNTRELAMFGLVEGDSAQLKYDHWDSSQKPANFVEIDYESLRNHPLYVAKEHRVNFHFRQTAV